MAVAAGRKRSTAHAHRNGILRHAGHTYAHGVLIARVEHVHQVGSHGGPARSRYHTVLLRKVAAEHFAGSVLREQITAKLMLAHTTGCERILAAPGVDFCSVDKYLGLHGAIYGGHHNVGREGFARIEGGFFGNDKGVELVHADVLHVDV